ncbi:Potassium voltage-gated channel sub H member 7 [Irineochytrium annulatum]|nr:Potassium voltage-gated channel sub H member 7 [Irineochytrium annulatum]
MFARPKHVSGSRGSSVAMSAESGDKGQYLIGLRWTDSGEDMNAFGARDSREGATHKQPTATRRDLAHLRTSKHGHSVSSLRKEPSFLVPTNAPSNLPEEGPVFERGELMPDVSGQPWHAHPAHAAGRHHQPVATHPSEDGVTPDVASDHHHAPSTELISAARLPHLRKRPESHISFSRPVSMHIESLVRNPTSSSPDNPAPIATLPQSRRESMSISMDEPACAARGLSRQSTRKSTLQHSAATAALSAAHILRSADMESRSSLVRITSSGLPTHSSSDLAARAARASAAACRPDAPTTTSASGHESSGNACGNAVQTSCCAEDEEAQEGDMLDLDSMGGGAGIGIKRRVTGLVQGTRNFAREASRRLRAGVTETWGCDDSGVGGSLEKLQDDGEAARGFHQVGFNPNSKLSVIWDLFMSAFYILLLWVVPILIAFDALPVIHYRIGIFFTLVNAIDIVINVYTPRSYHTTTSHSSTHPTLAAWRLVYLRHQFPWDLLGTFPFAALPLPSSPYTPLLLLARLAKLHHLPRIVRRSPVFRRAKKTLERNLKIGETFSNIFALVFVLSAFLHFQACTLLYVGKLANYSNPTIENIADEGAWDQYTWALFQSVGNTFPLAYKPLSTLEQWTVVFNVIIGAVLYASIVGTISAFTIGMDASGRVYKQKMDELHDYMTWKHVNTDTRRKVLQYYQIKYRGKFFEEGTLLGEMNDSLRTEIAVHNCRELISKVPFLRREEGDGRDELFIGRIATSLTPCYFVAGDNVVNQGEMGGEMYFILNGRVRILVNNNVVSSFGDGAFFGEVALIANIPRTATVQAVRPCVMYKLTRTVFMQILAEFEDMRARIDRIYQERMGRVRAEEEERRKKIAGEGEVATDGVEEGEEGEEDEEDDEVKE